MDEGQVLLTWLRFDDVECVRCRFICGDDGEDVYVVAAGCVCVDCATPEEKALARR